MPRDSSNTKQGGPGGYLACQSRLQELAQNTASLSAVCLSTLDGKVRAFAAAASEPTGARVAALSSSFLALADAFAKDVLQGSSRYTVVVTEHGTICSARVPIGKNSLALSIATDSTETVALALRLTLDTAEELSRMLA